MSPTPGSRRASDSVTRKILSIAVVTLMVACCFVIVDFDSSSAEERDVSGECGADLKWSLDTADGHLTITGTGAMDNYTRYSVRWGGNTVRSVSFPDGLTSIGNYAFYQTALDGTVTIPNNVTTIGEYAFKYCSDLKGVSIGAGVTNIKEDAFAFCSGLTTVTIPNNVTTVGYTVFMGCSALKNVSIGTGVTTIGGQAFDLCPKLESITVTAGNASFSSEDGVLFNSDKTTLVRYPAGKTGGSYTIPASVTYIRNGAFSYNEQLTSMVVPDSVLTIGYDAFNYCTGLTSITIGTGVNDIGTNVFEECSSLSSITVQPGNTIVSSENGVLFNSDKTTLIKYPAAKTDSTYTIPSTVKTIESYAFCGNGSLTSVTFPTGLTSIKNNAFENCSSLGSATIPDTVTSLGGQAFYYCTALATVNTGNGITSIQGNTFAHCANLSSLTIGTGVTSIGNYAFDSCMSLSAVTIPNSVTSIQDGAFQYCSGLTDVNLGSGLTNLASGAFLNCSKITKYTVDGSNTTYCSKDGLIFNKDGYRLVRYPAGRTDESYSISDDVIIIDDNAFHGAHNLKSVTIPATVTAIGADSFTDCTKLEYFSVAVSNPSYCSVDGVLLSNSKAMLIKYPMGNPEDTYTVPKTVTTIYTRSFAGCANLKTVNLPDSLVTIMGGAFTTCGIREMRIPGNVTTIYDGAFSFCTDLGSFTVSGSNANYCTVDGILYTKDKTQLVQCPMKYSGPVTIPDTADQYKVIMGVTGCSGITDFNVAGSSKFLFRDGALSLDGSVIAYASDSGTAKYTVSPNTIEVSNYALFANGNIEEIEVEDGNPYYYSKDGCLYSKYGDVLRLCPSGKSSYRFTSDVKGTGSTAFSGDGLKEITFASDSNVDVGQATFINCDSLKKIVIEEGATVRFVPNSFYFTDSGEHTIYVVAPDGYTIDESCFRGNVKVIYGEPPKDSNQMLLIAGGIVGIVVLAGAAVFLIRHFKPKKGGIE